MEELRTALQATAVQSVKTTRSLAKFDEINRLPAPAAQKAAAPEKEKRTAGNAGGPARRTAKGSDGRDWADGWRAVLDSLRGVWADFLGVSQRLFCAVCRSLADRVERPA